MQQNSSKVNEILSLTISGRALTPSGVDVDSPEMISSGSSNFALRIARISSRRISLRQAARKAKHIYKINYSIKISVSMLTSLLLNDISHRRSTKFRYRYYPSCRRFHGDPCKNKMKYLYQTLCIQE